MEMEIISHPSSGLKWKLGNEILFEIDDPQAIDGIRLNTDDGPGWYDSAPTVMYVDNFGIDNGTLLSAPSYTLPNEFEGRIYYGRGELILEYSNTKIQKVEVFNIRGQKIKSVDIKDNSFGSFRIPMESSENVIIVVFYNDKNRKYSRKLVTWE